METTKVKFAKCARCGVDFEVFYEKSPFKYCCSCREKNAEEGNTVIRHTNFCANCGNKFKGTHNQKYCSFECQKAARLFSGNYKLRFAILYRDNFRCQYCGATPQDGAKLHIDHIHPRSKGGTDDISNLITACEICNIGKKDLILDKKPLVGISSKAVKVLSTEILNRQDLIKIGISVEAIQMMLNLVKPSAN